MALRDNPFGELKVPLALTAAVALLVAVVLAVAILLSDRRETLKEEAYGVTRQVGDAVAAPVSGVVAAPGRWGGQGLDALRGYFFAVSENRRLKAELKEARQWRDVAMALRDTNDRYRALLGLKTEPPIPMVAARTVSDSRGPFANSRLANAGKEKGVEAGNPVMSENGLVGRIIGVTKGASRILLLTDVASRTPVMIDRTNARAILTGDGGPNPKLDYLRGKDPVRQGDRVMTSGDGGVLPRGLPVGVAVKGLDGRWRVVLASDAAPIDFVQILLFKDFTQLSDSAKAELDRMDPLPPSAGAATITTQTPPPAPIPSPQPAPKPATITPASAATKPPVRPTAPTTAKPAAVKPPVRKPVAPATAAAPAASPPAAEAEIPH